MHLVLLPALFTSSSWLLLPTPVQMSTFVSFHRLGVVTVPPSGRTRIRVERLMEPKSGRECVQTLHYSCVCVCEGNLTESLPF